MHLMLSSPRFTRGTSVIAALVFAAILGAVALSLNSFNSNAVNTSALPAQATAAAPTGASKSSCEEGFDYNYTVGPSVSYVPCSYGPFPSCPVIGPTAVSVVASRMCPTDAVALSDASGPFYANANNLPLMFTEKPISQRSQCNNGKQTKQDITCIYKLIGSAYQLQVVAPSTGPWTCHVNLVDPKATTKAQQCWNKDVPLGGVVNNTPSGQPNSGAISASTPSQPLPLITNNASNKQPTNNGANQTGGVLPQLPLASDFPNQTGGTPTLASTSDCTAIGAGGLNFTCNGQLPQATDFAGLGGSTASGAACPSGLTGTPPNCTPATQPATGNTGGTNPLSALSSLAGSFVNGLIGTPCTTQSSAVVGNGSTLAPAQVYNPTTNSYSTIYIQQGTAPTQGAPCTSAQKAPFAQSPQSAPNGVGSNGVACSAPPSAPQCPIGASAMSVSASGNNCITGYQCVPTVSTINQTPTPSLSCSPQVADVGQSVAITYSCINATGSSASGFSTNNQTSGTASSTITAPPSGTNTENFGLTCTAGGQKASTQCSVQVNQPAIDLVAAPQTVPSGQSTSIGWVTAGMQSCVISSPNDQNFTSTNANSASVNGVAQSDAITGTTEFDLTCTTLGGQMRIAKTTVAIGAASAAAVTVSSTADGKSVSHGGSLTITWSDSSAASSTVAAIWLIDIQTEQGTALVADAQPTSGTYTWQLPVAGSSCDTTSYAPCASDLVAGDSYGLEVALYTPKNAFIGPASSATANSVAPTYTDYGYTANPFTITQ